VFVLPLVQILGVEGIVRVGLDFARFGGITPLFVLVSLHHE